MMDDLKTHAENTWCPGCGNFGILNAVKKAVHILEEDGISRKTLAISAGIGCHAKIFDYLALSGLYSIHGRAVATIQGMKVANPGLKVMAFAGDGDAYGEGIAHLIFAAKRNADITVIVHNNGVYGLTTGQFTPTSEKGYRGPSTPQGSVEEPLNPLTLMLEAGATFVARGYPGKITHLSSLIVEAVHHEGFSFIDVLQPCVTFNNTYELYNERVRILQEVPATYEEAIKEARKRDTLPIGIFHRRSTPVYHRELYGDWNPVTNSHTREQRWERVRDLLSP